MLLKADIAITLILVLVILSGYLFIGGIGGKSFRTVGDPNGRAVNVESPTDNTQGKNLQLKTLTFKEKECLQTVAVDLLVDRSGSINGNGLQPLKKALESFTSQLSDDSVVGMQSFSSPNSCPSPYNTATSSDVEIGLYANVKDQLQSRITNLCADGYTYMRSGMILSKDKMQAAIPQYPDRQFAFIFLTDGDPNDGVLNSNPDSQDPVIAPNIADQIKQMGVTIYTIGFGNAITKSAFAQRLKEIATTPDRYYPAPNASELSAIYGQIGQRLCN